MPAEAPIDTDLLHNVANIREALDNSSDLIVRFIDHAGRPGALALLYIDGMSKSQTINESILDPLTSSQSGPVPEAIKDRVKQAISIANIQETNTLPAILSALVSGRTVIAIDGGSSALLLDTKQIESRTISEPTTQTVIRGPKDCFTENLRTNTSLVRARIQSPKLRLEQTKIGDVTQTAVEIMYLKDIADEGIVTEVRRRLQNIQIDGILESGYIESFIQDKQQSPFPTVLNTERPDIVAGNLLEGRVAIFISGTPFVLIVPVTFTQFFQSPEDYYQNPYIGSMLRFLRLVAFLLSLYAPSLYVAMITFHQALVPTVLLISIAAQREAIPFPVIVEALLMEVTFEVLREAGIRMPRAVGPALSIVGALILGQAAVEAGLVSAAIVIIVSITAIASFALPNYNIGITARLLRFLLLFVASYCGLYGLLIATLIAGMHMCGLRSFGVPYLAPMAPFRLREQKDVLLRFPIQSLSGPDVSKRTNE